MTFGQPKWSDAHTDRLKELWAEGFSASQIAVQLGGITKNAVIGKVHRLGLHHHQHGGDRKAVPHRTRGPGRKRSSQRTEPRVFTAEPRFAETASVDEVVFPAFVPAELAIPKPESRRLTFDELSETGMCKYIEGTKKPWTYCGHDALEDSSWCAYHRALCFPVVVTSKRFVLHSDKLTGAYR